MANMGLTPRAMGWEGGAPAPSRDGLQTTGFTEDANVQIARVCITRLPLSQHGSPSDHPVTHSRKAM